MGDLNKRPINMEGEAKNSNLQIAHLDLVQMYINLESTLAAKDARIAKLEALLPECRRIAVALHYRFKKEEEDIQAYMVEASIARIDAALSPKDPSES